MTGIALCAVVAVAGLATVVLDREQKPFGPGDRLLPGFSAGYECLDARDQLTADDLAYRLRYVAERWVARISVTVADRELRAPCSLSLGVPPGSRDTGDDAANVSLDAASASSGVATVPIRTGGEYLMSVTLPRDYELFHALGIGRYVLRFDFFAPGEGGSFKQGELEVRVPDGYSIVETLPAGAKPDASELSWKRPLKADRDQQAVVTFRHDRVRMAVDLAPEVAFGALALALGLVSFPQRRETPAEPERVAKQEPEVAVAREPEPEPEPPPEQEPEPVAVQPRLAPPPPLQPRPGNTKAQSAAAAGLGLVAAAIAVRLFRRRSRRG